MTQTTKEPPRLTDAQLAEMLALTKGADTVELKLTVPDAERRSTVSALGIDPLDAQIRQVFFFDTPDLACNRQRRGRAGPPGPGRGDDSVVKLRPVVPDELPAELRSSKDLVVEVDAMPGGFVCSASFKGTLGTTDVKEAAAGEADDPQAVLQGPAGVLRRRMRPSGVALDDLAILGPINVLKLKFVTGGVRPSAVVAELWLYPDGSRILELSTKCAPSEAFQVAAEAKAFLAEQGRRPLRRAADQDQDGPGVLRRRTGVVIDSAQ